MNSMVQAISKFALYGISASIFGFCALAPSALAQSHSEAPGTAQSDDYQLVHWDRRPIRLTLKVGEERMVWFPAAVQPGIPPDLAQKVRVQVNGDTVFFKPREAFSETRFPVRNLTTGQIYLLDLSASTSGSSENVRVLVHDETSPVGSVASVAANVPERRELREQKYGYVDLARYAARQLYAPDRLVDGLPGVFAASIDGTSSQSLIRGGDMLATPMASWREQGGLTVTAVRVTNLRSDSVEWDPRRIRGDWLAVAAQHPVFGPRGGADDTTVFYLISEVSFEEAAGPWLSQ